MLSEWPDGFRVPRPNMQFISIAEVLHTLASTVDLPEKWLDDCLKLSEIPETRTVFGREISMFGPLGKAPYRAQFESSFRLSQAAAQLDAALHNASEKAAGPVWYDKRQTNYPKISSGAQEAYLPVLVDLAGHFPRLLEAHRAGDLDLTGRSQKPLSRWHEFDAQLRDLVGFDESEITKLLGVERHPSASVDHAGAVAERAPGDSAAPALPPPAAPVVAQLSAPPRRLPFRHPVSLNDLLKLTLSEALSSIPVDCAVEKEQRRFVRDFVWDRLTALAGSDEKPSFLDGLAKSGDIKVRTPDGQDTYQYETLRRRVDREFNKRK